jgi:lysozyme
MTKDALDLIKHFEGLRLHAYQNPGDVPTIGYGHTKGVHLGQTITEHQADAFLLEDIQDACHWVQTHLGLTSEDGNHYGALVSLVFNVGSVGPGMIDDVKHQRWQSAADRFLQYANGPANMHDGLLKRRKAERHLFLGEDWRQGL